MSKITVAGVRQHVNELLDYSLNTKKRNFLGKQSTLKSVAPVMALAN